jgi:hypothetical protein
MLKDQGDRMTESVDDGESCIPLNEGDDSVKSVTRRKVLKHAGNGIAAGLLSAAFRSGSAAELWTGRREAQGEPEPERQPGKTSISLIIDDGSPVDPMFYLHPGYETPLLPPVEFYQHVADAIDRFELRGKMTVLPMPSCLGRLDQSVKLVPQQHLEKFLTIVRERIAPRFDITPEFLTHLDAYILKTGSTKGGSLTGGGYQHMFEDVWISGAPLEEIVEYFNLAFTILKNVGLDPTGMTSPWDSGIDVENKYAQAVSEAQWKTFDRKFAWYFLHTADWGMPQQCSVTYESPERDRVVVSVPANFPDVFWSMDLPRDQRPRFISDNIDRVLSPDGRTGRIRQLIESGHPVTLLTHWQSLYTQGTELGLEGLIALMERIKKEFGSSVEWVSCSERARRYVDSMKAGV